MSLTIQTLTLEQYLCYDDGTDKRYELIAGELTEMPPESPRNSAIALKLLFALARLFPESLLSHKDIEIVVSGRRATTRLPDVMVLTEELALLLQSSSRGTITLDMPPPVLVIEVVSPGKANEDRDYRYKRSEYAARGILEYWIVDPIKQIVIVLSLVDGLYEEIVFQGIDKIQSLVVPDFPLNVEQLFLM
jgi:Uma2 family endonuclease